MHMYVQDTITLVNVKLLLSRAVMSEPGLGSTSSIFLCNSIVAAQSARFSCSSCLGARELKDQLEDAWVPFALSHGLRTCQIHKS